MERIHRNLPWNSRSVRWDKVVIAFIVAATLTQLVIWVFETKSPSMLDQPALCIGNVIDSDTFRLCNGDKIRLVAASGPVDAPETSYRPGRWNDKVIASRAQRRLEQLIEGGVLYCDGFDRYERRLCRVTVAGRDVGDQMVAEGLAVIRDEWR
jgi:micrococcal nuclease